MPEAPQKQQLLCLMQRFNNACNYVSQFAFQNKRFGTYDLHEELYYEIRARFGLPAQLAVRVFAKVAYAYKTEHANANKKERKASKCHFKATGAVPYDARLLTYGKDNLCSLRLLESRVILPTVVWNPALVPFCKGEADLVYKKGKFYLLQTLDLPDKPLTEVTDFLGVDMGIVNVAVDSDGSVYTDERIEHKRRQYSRHRQSLKQKHTKNSRRRLSKLGRREACFRKDVNHCISKNVAALSSRTCRGIALVGVANLIGRTFMEPLDDPFRAADEIIACLSPHTSVIFIDFHAETTSEKMAMGWYCDGRVSAVIGTHTHVQTADERILPAGTGYLTDAGMCGPENSVIGMDVEIVLARFRTQMPHRFEVADGPARLCGVIVDIDEATGKARRLERISRLVDES